MKHFLLPDVEEKEIKDKAKLYNMLYELIYIGGIEYDAVMKMDYKEARISHQALINIKGD